jgi:hypothetical protein
MIVSLDQAIEMYATALEHRAGAQAGHLARDKADRCEAAGDHDGFVVWIKVAAVAEALLISDAAAAAVAPPIAN